MRTSLRRRLAVLGGAGLLAATVGVATGVMPAGAGTATNTNACFSGVTGTYSDIDVTLIGTGAPNPSTLGVDTITTSGDQLVADVPAALLIAAYNLGFVADGDLVPVSFWVAIEGTNTVEGVQIQTGTVTAPLTITDDDGIPGTGDEGALPLSLSAALPPTSWTPTGGDVVIGQAPPGTLGSIPGVGVGGASVAANGSTYFSASVAGGLVTANFDCQPGVTDLVDNTTFAPATSITPFDTVTVIAPPAPPVANDDASSVGAGQSVTINVVNNDTDQNGDLDPTSVAVVATTAGGLLTNNGDGTLTYDNTDGAIGTDTFTYTVADTGGNGPSNVATVAIQVFGDLCDATSAPCSLSQVLIVPVLGSTMTLEQEGLASQFQVTMIDAASIAGPDGLPGTPDDTLASAAPIVLNGQPQLAVGNLYQMTVTNARGTDDPWSLTGQVTSFSDGTVLPTCDASDPLTWNNHCIPGDNLGWTPSAAVAHTQVPGDVAAVNAGSSLFSPGFFGSPATTITGLGSSPQTLCDAGAGTSGGTFTCDAGLGLSVPASAAAGIYVAQLTLTLA